MAFRPSATSQPEVRVEGTNTVEWHLAFLRAVLILHTEKAKLKRHLFENTNKLRPTCSDGLERDVRDTVVLGLVEGQTDDSV